MKKISQTSAGWSGSGKLVFPFLGAKSHMRSPQDRLNIQVWLFQVRFRLAVLETARGRLRASSYGFKASLWFECIALSDLNNIFKLICKLKKGGVKSIFTIEIHAMYLSRPPDALKSLIRLYVGLRTGYDLGYITFWVESGFSSNFGKSHQIIGVFGYLSWVFGLGIDSMQKCYKCIMN